MEPEENIRALDLIARALTKEGFGALVGQHRPLLSGPLAGFFVFLGFVIPTVVTTWSYISWWAGVAVFLVALVAVSATGDSERRAQVVVGVMFVAWFGTALLVVSDQGWGALGLTHGLVILGLIVGMFFRLDFSALLRSLPLLAPLSLLVLLIPLLTADVWEAAAQLTPTDLVLLALVLVLPVLVALYRRLKGLLFQAYAETSGLLASEDVLLVLNNRVTEVSSPADAEWLLREAVPLVSERADEERLPGFVGQVAAALHGQFSRTLAQRLLPTAIAVGALTSLYLYILSIIAVPQGVATHWSGQNKEALEINFIWHVTPPGGAYLKVAALLGVAATAIFLALVLTDDRYSAALYEALLHQPAYQSLALGVPYLALLEADEALDERTESAVRRKRRRRRRKR